MQYNFGACPGEFNIANRYLLDEYTVWRAISLAGAIPTDGLALLPSLCGDVALTIDQPKIWLAVDAVATALLHNRELAGCEVEDVAMHAMTLHRYKPQ